MNGFPKQKFEPGSILTIERDYRGVASFTADKNGEFPKIEIDETGILWRRGEREGFVPWPIYVKEPV